MRAPRLAILVAILGSGCFDVDFPEGTACSPMGNCPLGMMCVDGVCLDDEHVPDAGPGGGGSQTHIAAGEDHTCAIDGDGNLSCWGRNGAGQLGGLPPSRMEPPTLGGTGPWIEVGAGVGHTCGLKANGEVWCWGENDAGQLGTTGPSDHPAGVYRHLAVGAYHTCAIDNPEGALFCWGMNGEGQLGDAAFTDPFSVAPRRVPGGPWLQAALGFSHTCAIELGESHLLKCWGHGDYGQLGTGSEGPSPSPTEVARAPSLTRVAAGYYHTCFIAAGHLACTGSGPATGLGDLAPISQFGDIGDFGDLTWVGAGSEHTCVIRANGARYCFGMNAFGQLGDDTNDGVSKGVPPSDPQDADVWAQIDGGTYHSCGIRASGEVYCWGGNEWGQVAQPPAQRATPAAVAFPDSFVAQQVSANGEEGRAHTCAVVDPGQIWCWGSNDYGQLGLGSGPERNLVQITLPTQVGTDEDWQQVVTGTFHTCALKRSGALYCWGLNEASQCGVGPTIDTSSPVQVEPGTNYLEVALGKYHTCAVEVPGGTLMCTGDNTHGQLGDGTTASKLIYRHPGKTYSRVFAGDFHSCAEDVTSGIDVLACWGKNDRGQVGNVDADDPQLSPFVVAGSYQALDADGGREHTCFRHLDAIFCFGSNESGQLGTPSITGFTEAPEPVDFEFTSSTRVSTGVAHTCSLHGGSTLCWGSNDFQALGDTGDGRTSPMAVEIAGMPVAIDVAAGPFHTCVVTAQPAGDVLCWGSNGFGQLGDDHAWEVLPQRVDLPTP